MTSQNIHIQLVYGELVSYHSAPCIVTDKPLHNCHIGTGSPHIRLEYD